MNGDSYSRGESRVWSHLQSLPELTYTRRRPSRRLVSRLPGLSHCLSLAITADTNCNSHPDATATTDAAATAQAEAGDDPAHHTNATDRAATTGTPTHTLRAGATKNASERTGTAEGTGGQIGSGTAIVVAATGATEDGATMTDSTDGADVIFSMTAAAVGGEMEADAEEATTLSRRCEARLGAGLRRPDRLRSASLLPT